MSGNTLKDAAAVAGVILERCSILSRCTEHSGEIRRTFLSPAMDDAHAHLRKWMEQAGLTVRLDTAGNILGLSTAATPVTPRLLIGSHLDAVPNAGAYDGTLGVVLAVSLAEARQGTVRNFALDVVGFSEEEGVRYSAPFLGSKLLVGSLENELFTRRDTTGLALQDALSQFKATHPEAIAPRVPDETRGYLEFHIEQGPVLESLALPLGVVTAIAGQTRCMMTFIGKAGHAGTTPMGQRQDALAAASEWISLVERLALATPGLVATVGQISVEPSVINVIPVRARCSLDLRHAEDGRRDQSLSELLKAAHEIAGKRHIRFDWELTHAQAAVPMHPEMIEMAEHAIAQAGYPVHQMVSGAGHDAMVLASHLASGMIFLRSPGGLSHHPDETVLADDVAAAFIAGNNFLNQFERAVSAGKMIASA